MRLFYSYNCNVYFNRNKLNIQLHTVIHQFSSVIYRKILDEYRSLNDLFSSTNQLHLLRDSPLCSKEIFSHENIRIILKYWLQMQVMQI